jgi:hypothetical protein
LKVVDLVRKAVGGESGWAASYLEVKMRCNGVAGVSDESKHLAKLDLVAAVDLDTAGLQVCVEGEAVISETENDGVSVRLSQRDIGGVFAGRLLWQAIGD